MNTDTKKLCYRRGIYFAPYLFQLNRFPQELDEMDKPVSFVKTRVVLCIWGKGHLPVLAESSVKSLVSVINESILFGTHGCTLTWGKQAWQLDTGIQTDAGVLLDKSAILPLECTGAPPTGFVWDPGLSWLGFLPRRFPHHVHRHLKAFPAHIANNFEVCSAPLFYAAKRPIGRSL